MFYCVDFIGTIQNDASTSPDALTYFVPIKTTVLLIFPGFFANLTVSR